MKNLIGKVFGRLTVVERLENHVAPCGLQIVKWRCSCSCGETTEVSSNSLSTGKVKSCGCLAKEMAAQKGFLNATHGGYSKNRSLEDQIKFQALINIRERSKRRGYESDLEMCDLPGLTDSCPVLGIKYSRGSLKDKNFSPSIDRKNTNLPYLKKYKDNLVFISHRANRIKSDATIEELQKILQYLQKE
jgi:hypothetical protein